VTAIIVMGCDGIPSFRSTDVGVGAPCIHHAHVWRAQQLLHGRPVDRRHVQRGVDAAFDQRVSCGQTADLDQRRRRLSQAVVAGHRHAERMRAAAGQADRQAPAAQLRDAFDSRLAAIEHPDRLVKQAA
jgi:hypothetical protein